MTFAPAAKAVNPGGHLTATQQCEAAAVRKEQAITNDATQKTTNAHQGRS
jgi:hypothetical protein